MISWYKRSLASILRSKYISPLVLETLRFSQICQKVAARPVRLPWRLRTIFDLVPHVSLTLCIWKLKQMKLRNFSFSFHITSWSQLDSIAVVVALCVILVYIAIPVTKDSDFSFVLWVSSVRMWSILRNPNVHSASSRLIITLIAVGEFQPSARFQVSSRLLWSR